MTNGPATGDDVDIESELLDLGAVSLMSLKHCGGAEFDRALRYVVEQTGSPRMAKGGSCSNMGFD